jgi:hypothetical protein
MRLEQARLSIKTGSISRTKCSLTREVITECKYLAYCFQRAYDEKAYLMNSFHRRVIR